MRNTTQKISIPKGSYFKSPFCLPEFKRRDGMKPKGGRITSIILLDGDYTIWKCELWKGTKHLMCNLDFMSKITALSLLLLYTLILSFQAVAIHYIYNSGIDRGRRRRSLWYHEESFFSKYQFIWTLYERNLYESYVINHCISMQNNTFLLKFFRHIFLSSLTTYPSTSTFNRHLVFCIVFMLIMFVSWNKRQWSHSNQTTNNNSNSSPLEKRWREWFLNRQNRRKSSL